jgi:hypothetical protein
MPPDYPTSLIMWSWQDDHVEQHRLLDDAIADIAAHGFSGTLAMLRGCRYPLSDPLVIDAARHASARAHRAGLAFWFGLDPRLDQGRLIEMPGGRNTYLVTGREADALPCVSSVGADGRYRARLEYGPPREQHMLSQVAATFEPDAISAVVAYRTDTDGRLVVDSVRDVSAGARLFIQRRAGYFEIFGQLEPPPGPGWAVLTLARCTSTYPDLGSDAVLTAVEDLYRTYAQAGVELDGVFWDEIGQLSSFAADRSRLPWSPAVHDAFARRHGGQLDAALPLLLLDDDAGLAGTVRRDYYSAVQDVVISAQARCWQEARRVWGDDVDNGIHQTWHQDADDLPHGSGDWWRGSVALSGGFTDVGDAERAGEPEHLDEVLSMVVTAASLSRHHEHPRAFCNVWGVDYGEETVDWWVRLLSAFGVTWLAHMYGPTSYIEHETGWGPGYPHHPTWDHLASANETAARIRRLTGGTVPEANVAVVYPIGTLARVGDASANVLARDAHRAIAELVRRGVAIDVISPDLFGRGSVGDGALWLTAPHRRLRYEAVVYPHGVRQALDAVELDRIRELGDAGVAVVLDTVLPDLPRLVEAPAGALATCFRRPDATTTLVVTPLLPDSAVDGEVRTTGIHVGVDDLRGIAAVRFDGAGRVLEHWSRDGTIDVHAGSAAP